MKLFDLSHPFFAPRWRRIAIVVFCLVWAGVELWFGNMGWAAVVGGLGAYAAWQFLTVKAPEPP